MIPNTQEVLKSAKALPTEGQLELIEALIAGLDEAVPEALDEAALAYVAQFQKSFRDFPAFPAGDLRKTRGFA